MEQPFKCLKPNLPDVVAKGCPSLSHVIAGSGFPLALQYRRPTSFGLRARTLVGCSVISGLLGADCRASGAGGRGAGDSPSLSGAASGRITMLVWAKEDD